MLAAACLFIFDQEEGGKGGKDKRTSSIYTVLNTYIQNIAKGTTDPRIEFILPK